MANAAMKKVCLRIVPGLLENCQPHRAASSMPDRLLGQCTERLRRMRRNATYQRQEEMNPSVQQPHVMLNHYPRKLLSFCSTDYLGLSTNPSVVAAFNRSTYETNISPTHRTGGPVQSDILALESTVSDFHEREQTLTFASLDQCMTSTFFALFDNDDVIFCDENSEGSAQLTSRACTAQTISYMHCNLNDLEAQLLSTNNKGMKVIFTQGYYTSTGRATNLRKLMDLADEYDALVILDDSQSVGIMGSNLRGMEETLKEGQSRPMLLFGSLEHAFGQSQGAYVTGPSQVIETIKATNAIYRPDSAVALHPAVAKVANLILAKNGGLKKIASSVRGKGSHLKKALNSFGLLPFVDTHPSVSVVVGHERRVDHVMDQLLDMGVLVSPVKRTTFPNGAARVSLHVTAVHSYEHLDQLMEAILAVARRCKLLGQSHRIPNAI